MEVIEGKEFHVMTEETANEIVNNFKELSETICFHYEKNKQLHKNYIRMLKENLRKRGRVLQSKVGDIMLHHKMVVQTQVAKSERRIGRY